MKNINDYIRESEMKVLKEEECYEINGGWSFKAVFSFAVAIGNFAVGVFNGWNQHRNENRDSKPSGSNVYLRDRIA